MSNVDYATAQPHSPAILGGVKRFLIIWCGQFLSLIGSGLTAFALGVWVYQSTESVTKFALISVCATLPIVLFSPLAGTLVDRYGRRWAMLVGNSGAGLSTLAIILLLADNRLELWHIYLATAIGSAFIALQRPAYNASVTSLIPKKHYGRANGLIQLGYAVSSIGSPLLGAMLLLAAGITAVLVIDFATFAFATLTLLLIRIPERDRAVDGQQARSFWAEVSDGWNFLVNRPDLLSLTVFFAICTFIITMVSVLVTPLVLGFTSATALGTIMSIGGMGMVMGSLVVSAWGGPRQRVKGVIGFMFVAGVCITLAGVRPSMPLIAAAACGYFFAQPIISSCTQTIIQTKVPTDLQGRIFALLTMIAWSAAPLAYPVAGPLADHIFEPMLSADGALAGSVGWLIGVGPGRGIGFIFVLMGLLVMLTSLLGYTYPALRKLEDELPEANLSKAGS